MTTTTVRAGIVRGEASGRAGAADDAGDLVGAFAAMAVDDPARAAARDRAIEAWLPLARHLAQRYAGRGEPLDDLFQIATVGLLKAIDRFDPGYGIDFAGFAIPTVLGEIKRHFRDRTWSIRVPRRLQEMRQAVTAANSTLTHALGRSPTVADIAVHLRVSEEQVLEGLEGGRAYRATSLSAPASAGNEMTLADTLGHEDHELELAETRIALGPALACLDEQERKIVTLRFYGNLTQTQIAVRVGVSQMQVSRVLNRALVKLRRQLGADAALTIG